MRNFCSTLAVSVLLGNRRRIINEVRSQLPPLTASTICEPHVCFQSQKYI